jgi:hypothetical protein
MTQTVSYAQAAKSVARDPVGYLTEKRSAAVDAVGAIFDELTAAASAGEPDGLIAAKLFAADEANGLLSAVANLLLPSYSRSPVNCLQPAYSLTRAAFIDRLTTSVPISPVTS